MDFFNKLGDLANKAGKKTGDLTKEAKIKMKMNENKSKIEDLYKEIGKVIYQKHIDTAEFKKEDISDFCTQIDNLSDEIEKYQNEIRKIKNKRMCEKCATEIDINVKYCPNCGAEQPEQPKEEVLEAEIVEENKDSNETAESKTEDDETTKTIDYSEGEDTVVSEKEENNTSE